MKGVVPITWKKTEVPPTTGLKASPQKMEDRQRTHERPHNLSVHKTA